MSFWDHTKELIRRLKVVLYTLVISTVLMMVLPSNFSFFSNPFEFYEPLVAVILKFVREQALPQGVKLIGLEFVAPIELYFVASFILGLAISAPVLAYEIFRFIDPALYPHERRDVYPFMSAFLLLFVIGIVFGYEVLTPVLMRATIPFFTVVGAEPIISVMDFYTIVFVTTIVTGACFTFPVFIVLLAKYGIMGTQTLRKRRVYLYLALFVITALITPDGGPIADLLLFIPMLVLVELGILFARRYEKKGATRRFSLFTPGATCRFCGGNISTDTTFCPKCGKSQK
ncbi:MAG: twin-arginine translocase subunit TatC [Candidatus Bathyarchaeia archaeon]